MLVSSSQLKTTKLIGGGVWPEYMGAPPFHGASGMDRDVDKGAICCPLCFPIPTLDIAMCMYRIAPLPCPIVSPDFCLRRIYGHTAPMVKVL